MKGRPEGIPRPFTGRHLTDARKQKLRKASRGNSAARGRVMSLADRGDLSAVVRNRTLDVIGECVYCFGPATEHDHVIPRGRPGWDDPDNLVPACGPCNNSKGPRTPAEWFAA